jgi:hypothetical protein
MLSCHGWSPHTLNLPMCCSPKPKEFRGASALAPFALSIMPKRNVDVYWGGVASAVKGAAVVGHSESTSADICLGRVEMSQSARRPFAQRRLAASCIHFGRSLNQVPRPFIIGVFYTWMLACPLKCNPESGWRDAVSRGSAVGKNPC